MNENLQNAVTALIEKSLGALESAQNFLVAEIPDVIQQLLMWKFTISLIYFSLGMFFILIFPVIANLIAWKYTKKFEMENDPWLFTPSLLFSILSVVVGWCMVNLTWLQIWIAPKIFLIEYAAKLIK